MATKQKWELIDDERITIGCVAIELTMALRNAYSQRVPYADSFDASYYTTAYHEFESSQLSSAIFYAEQLQFDLNA